MKPNFGATAKDYGAHRAGFPDSFFDRVRTYDVGLPGQAMVDLGTGTGTLARGFAKRGCTVIGIDPAAPMLEEGRRLAAESGLEVELRIGRAEQTGLPDGCADVVVAGQCWHWFDRRAATSECTRILGPDGKLVIAHFDWLPLPGNVVEATEHLIEAHNPDWKLGGGMGLHPHWLRSLARDGYRDLETFSFDVDTPYSPEAWRGRIRASAGVAAVLSQDRVEAFDRDLAALLRERFPEDPLPIPHRVFALIARPPRV